MTTHMARNVVPDAGPLQPALHADRPGYFVAGAGTPVVMLHSSLSSKSQWAALAERLASRFRVIALDLCGYGDNAVSATGAPFTLDDEVQLVMDRLDHLGEAHTRVHLVGHSYGGLVALRFAQCRIDRVASLSLYEPVAFRLLDDEDTALVDVRRLAELVSRLAAAGHRHAAAQVFVDFWSGDSSYASLPLPARASIVRRVDKLPLEFQAALSWPRGPEDLRAIVAPTLLLGGNRSPAVVQRIHTVLTRTLPNRRSRSFDSGHMGPITDAHRLNPWIEAFLDTCAERAAPFAAPNVVSPSSWVSVAD
jgi:pimeloyl-ACP methyl ester carboxylesterase